MSKIRSYHTADTPAKPWRYRNHLKGFEQVSPNDKLSEQPCASHKDTSTMILFPFMSWWKRDTALHSFVFCQFLIGLPFTVFNTYIIYQLQVVGYVIGSDADGGLCTTYCIVPWAGTRLDLNSVLLYLNAISFGVGGIVTLFLSAYSDFWGASEICKWLEFFEGQLTLV